MADQIRLAAQADDRIYVDSLVDATNKIIEAAKVLDQYGIENKVVQIQLATAIAASLNGK